MTRPKKSLGQNFLIDQNVIDKIINTVKIKVVKFPEPGPISKISLLKISTVSTICSRTSLSIKKF